MPIKKLLEGGKKGETKDSHTWVHATQQLKSA
jgi:hypothetical protein